MNVIGGALVTGGARRVGAAMVRALAVRGYPVAIHYNTGEHAAEALAQEIRSQGGQAEILQANLLDRAETAELIPTAAQALGMPLSVLINNASIFEHDTLQSATWQSWDRHIGSNLRAPFELTQAFAAQAPAATRDENDEPIANASVINMIDQRVLKLTPEFSTYTIAKMGLYALTKTAAQALAPDIRVNAIGPGPTLQGARQSKDHFQNQRAATILQRGSNLADICAALNFILDAPGFTGQLLCVDGGQHLAWQTIDVLGVE